MRKIVKVFSIIILILSGISAYGNQKEVLSVKKQPWDKRVYSGNKLRDGNIKIVTCDDANKIIIVTDMNFNNGIPIGDFKLCDIKNKTVIDGKGLWENGIFKGEMNIDIPDLDIKGKAYGKFRIDFDKFLNFTGNPHEALDIASSLYDGEYKTNLKEFSMRVGRLEGKMILYNKSGGKIKEENYKEGKLDGKSITYTEDGQIMKEQNYKEGKLNGESLFYSQDSETSRKYLERKIEYKNGKIDGVYIYYAQDGRIVEKANYKEGLLNGPFVLYGTTECYIDISIEEGSEEAPITYLIAKGKYKDGKKEGKFLYGCERDIHLLIERNYKEGLLNGEYSIFYQYGLEKYVQIEGECEDGERAGETDEDYLERLYEKNETVMDL